MNDITIFSIHVLLYMTALGLGFVIGKVTNPTIYNHPSVHHKKIVEIDDKKFVTNITTDKLIKKGVELGTHVTVNDDVGASVSKLSQLKKNK